MEERSGAALAEELISNVSKHSQEQADSYDGWMVFFLCAAIVATCCFSVAWYLPVWWYPPPAKPSDAKEVPVIVPVAVTSGETAGSATLETQPLLSMLPMLPLSRPL